MFHNGNTALYVDLVYAHTKMTNCMYCIESTPK